MAPNIEGVPEKKVRLEEIFPNDIRTFFMGHLVDMYERLSFEIFIRLKIFRFHVAHQNIYIIIIYMHISECYFAKANIYNNKKVHCQSLGVKVCPN